MLAALAWRNIWRQPIRTALSVAGMAFASMLLVFMLSFQFGSYDIMKSSMLKISEGFGQFQAPGYRDAPETATRIEDPAALIAELAGLAQVAHVSARSSGFALFASGETTFAAMVMGIDPVHEPEVTTIATLVPRGRALAAGDGAAVVLGAGLARNLRVGPGGQVTLLGTAADGSVAADVLEVVGIFETGVPEIDRQMAQMPLSRFDQAFLMEGGVNLVAISGDFYTIARATPLFDRLAARHGLVYLDWGEIRPEIKSAIQLDMATAMVLYVTLVVVVVFIILNTLYMSVLERTREFGMLLALGMKPGQIGRLVWIEMILLAVFGCGLGLVLGIGLTAWFESVGISIEGMEEIYRQWGLPARLYPDMTPFRVLFGPVAVLASVMALGVIPYRRVLRLEPVPAMAGA